MRGTVRTSVGSRYRWLAPLVVTAMLMGAAPGWQGTVSAAQPFRDWLPEVADSATLRGPTIAEGRLTAAGQVAAGRVHVVAWPRQEVLATLRVGDRVKTVPIGKALVDSDGRFAIRIDPATPLDEVTEDDGTINLDLYASTSDGLRIRSFSRRLDAGRWVEPGQGDRPATDRSAVPDAPALELSGAPFIPSGDVATAVAAGDKYCEAVVRAHYNDRLVIVGELYTGPNAKADLTYSDESQSTLGAGISITGTAGSWSTSGTYTMTSGAEINFPTQFQNKNIYLRSSWRYTKFENRCLNGDWETISFVTRPTLFDGGRTWLNAAGPPTATYCSTIWADPTKAIVKNTGTAVTLSNGVEISGVIGIDLSSKSGYDVKVKQSWWFLTNGKLCGSNASWPSAARLVGK